MNQEKPVTNEQDSQANGSGNRPAMTNRLGPLRIAIWNNTDARDDRVIVRQDIRFSRNYRDKDGNWQSTTGFRVEDLHNLRYLLDWVIEKTLKEENSQGL